ncbi:MAG: hypothetical protein C0506_05570 [Anaerolinea sp.]|nr:hypothetical protein [Anaerolinea sp.]
MKLFRKPPAPARPPGPPSFGAWLVARFAGEESAAELPFAKLERACGNAGSLICGAVLARPASFGDKVRMDADTLQEAGLVAKRTANGFQASLADRDNVVLSWPWDHLATRVAWRATQRGPVSEEAVGDELLRIGATYAIAHREQLEAARGVWEEVVAGLRPGGEASLTRMGADMLAAYEAETGGGAVAGS